MALSSACHCCHALHSQPTQSKRSYSSTTLSSIAVHPISRDTLFLWRVDRFLRPKILLSWGNGEALHVDTRQNEVVPSTHFVNRRRRCARPASLAIEHTAPAPAIVQPRRVHKSVFFRAACATIAVITRRKIFSLETRTQMPSGGSSNTSYDHTHAPRSIAILSSMTSTSAVLKSATVHARTLEGVRRHRAVRDQMSPHYINDREDGVRTKLAKWASEVGEQDVGGCSTASGALRGVVGRTPDAGVHAVRLDCRPDPVSNRPRTKQALERHQPLPYRRSKMRRHQSATCAGADQHASCGIAVRCLLMQGAGGANDRQRWYGTIVIDRGSIYSVCVRANGLSE